ncbi:MAG: 50S ribosomal protein L4 [Deltaproteobacteria bacterium]|nr:50S ribosomal protein L4 [Deltaproteobacteria bacterium]MBM4322112.1 50S ribosomal protein L4 [Deltaproteobacteria bacterium]MBM4347009.1 50S ribosomal protein L4 [Deltaproteobacteria bacterium]
MSLLAVYDINRQKVKEIELNDRIFDAKINPSLFYDSVRSHLASQRKGTAATKNRALIRGGGAKPYRQKGTGRARAGTRRSPLWRGGGTIFGPMPKDYSFSLTKRARRVALLSALSLKRQEEKLILLNDFPLEGFKTRQVLEILKKFNAENALIVTDDKHAFLERSARNIPGIEVLRYNSLNVYDILNHEYLILLTTAVEKIEGVFAS